MPKNWAAAVPAGRFEAGLGPIENVVRFERGRVTWDDVPIDDQTLRQYLTATSKLVPQPRLIVDVGPMDCSTLDRIVAAVKRAGVDCSYGKCIATNVIDPPAPPAPPRHRD